MVPAGAEPVAVPVRRSSRRSVRPVRRSSRRDAAHHVGPDAAPCHHGLGLSIGTRQDRRGRRKAKRNSQSHQEKRPFGERSFPTSTIALMSNLPDWMNRAASASPTGRRDIDSHQQTAITSGTRSGFRQLKSVEAVGSPYSAPPAQGHRHGQAAPAHRRGSTRCCASRKFAQLFRAVMAPADRDTNVNTERFISLIYLYFLPVRFPRAMVLRLLSCSPR